MILVTGATGFLGQNVCALLTRRNISFQKTSLSLGCDLRDRTATLSLFEKLQPQAVIHCAAFVGGIQFGYKYPVEMFEDNLLMNLNIYRAAHHFKTQRVVNPVSNCTYPGELSFFQEEDFWKGPLHESVKYYGLSRKATVVAAQAYEKEYGLDVINLVLPNMYGPCDHFEAERSHALGALIKKCVDAEKNNFPTIDVWGTGSPVREWLYVEDAAESLVRALDLPPQKEILNVGTGQGISIKDLVQEIAKVTQFKGSIVFDATKPDGAPFKTMDGSRARELMNWAPCTSLQHGLQNTVQWYKNHYMMT